MWPVGVLNCIVRTRRDSHFTRPQTHSGVHPVCCLYQDDQQFRDQLSSYWDSWELQIWFDHFKALEMHFAGAFSIWAQCQVWNIECFLMCVSLLRCTVHVCRGVGLEGYWWWWWWYHSLMAHQHQKGHTVPKQVIMIARSIQVATV